MTVTGKGIFQGTVTKTFEIIKKQGESSSGSDESADSGFDEDDDDYDADYDYDEDADDESVTNSGTQKVKKPGRVKIISVSAGKRKLTVSWNRKSGVSGYQIQCAQNKKFTKKKKSRIVGRYKSRATIKNLKKGKKYYVRVCAYKKKNGKKVCGKWSKIKNVKI